MVHCVKHVVDTFLSNAKQIICLSSLLVVSTLAIQVVAGLILTLLFLILSIKRCRDYQKLAMKRIEEFVSNLLLSDNMCVSLWIVIFERQHLVLLLWKPMEVTILNTSRHLICKLKMTGSYWNELKYHRTKNPSTLLAKKEMVKISPEYCSSVYACLLFLFSYVLSRWFLIGIHLKYPNLAGFFQWSVNARLNISYHMIIISFFQFPVFFVWFFLFLSNERLAVSILATLGQVCIWEWWTNRWKKTSCKVVYHRLNHFQQWIVMKQLHSLGLF